MNETKVLLSSEFMQESIISCITLSEKSKLIIFGLLRNPPIRALKFFPELNVYVAIYEAQQLQG